MNRKRPQRPTEDEREIGGDEDTPQKDHSVDLGMTVAVYAHPQTEGDEERPPKGRRLSGIVVH